MLHKSRHGMTAVPTFFGSQAGPGMTTGPDMDCGEMGCGNEGDLARGGHGLMNQLSSGNLT